MRTKARTAASEVQEQTGAVALSCGEHGTVYSVLMHHQVDEMEGANARVRIFLAVRRGE